MFTCHGAKANALIVISTHTPSVNDCRKTTTSMRSLSIYGKKKAPFKIGLFIRFSSVAARLVFFLQLLFIAYLMRFARSRSLPSRLRSLLKRILVPPKSTDLLATSKRG